jgi:putative NADH-flavin reductase
LKIALFGATGRTGHHILHAAVADGHQINVLVRNPSKMVITHEEVVLFLGDALDEEMVEYTMRECDVVASALGLNDNQQPEALSRSTANIVAGMENLGLQRLVVVGGAGILRVGAGDHLRMDQPDFAPAYLPYALEHLRIFELLKQSRLDWTLLCPPALHDQAAHAPLRAEVDFLPSGGEFATYAAVGRLAYELLSTLDYNQQRVGIAE